jgi:hypothetical protein
MARPSKFSPEAQRRFLEAIAGGAFPEVAAKRAGWSARTYYRYRSARRAFAEEVEAAEAQLELHLGAVVVRGALGDPRLALQLLAKRFPARWGRQAEFRAADQGADEPAEGRELSLDPALLDQIAARLVETSRRLQTGASPAADRIERFEDRGQRRGNRERGEIQ